MAPKGIPEWKQPGFDDDDKIREKDMKYQAQVSGTGDKLLHLTPLLSGLLGSNLVHEE